MGHRTVLSGVLRRNGCITYCQAARTLCLKHFLSQCVCGPWLWVSAYVVQRLAATATGGTGVVPAEGLST